MILRLELPKPIPVHSAMGMTVYLDGKRIYRVNTIDASISKYRDTAKWLDKYTCEIDGKFRLQETNGLIDIYAE